MYLEHLYHLCTGQSVYLWWVWLLALGFEP